MAELENENGYVSKDVFNDRILTGREKKLIEYYKELYERAKLAGDQKGMEEAHANAEAIRKLNGYSGGADGSEYLIIEEPKEEVVVDPKIEISKNELRTDLAKESIREGLLSRLFDEYSKSVKESVMHNPYESDYAKEILKNYDAKGEIAAEGEAIKGMGENSGNFDSFAAANANRQKLAYKDAANEAILNQYNAKVQSAYNLYKELAAAIAKI